MVKRISNLHGEKTKVILAWGEFNKCYEQQWEIALTAAKTENASVILIWAAFNNRHMQQRAESLPAWKSVTRLIAVSKQLFESQSTHLRALLHQTTEALQPLGDPLLIDFGGHRWLASDREEAYSDWLQWIVERVGEPESIFRLFGEHFHASADWNDVKVEVQREILVPEGHEGSGGRLDLVIRFHGKAVFVVEVKKSDADDADTGKQVGYRAWLDMQPEPFKRAYLVAADAGEETSHGDFRFVSWANICGELRRLVRPLCQNHKMVVAAMILAFVGAVEQNLLDFNASSAHAIMDNRVVPFNSRIIGHLEKSLKKEN